MNARHLNSIARGLTRIARRLVACLALALAVIAVRVEAVPIQLYNTGMDPPGLAAIVPHGQIDTHYSIVSPPNMTAVTVNDTTFPFPPWAPNAYGPGGSRWIGPSVNSQGPAVPYTYRTQFTLPANAILSSATIAGLWATDDWFVDVFLNNVPQGQTNLGFTSLQPFTVTSGFQVGVNNLEFRLINAGGPTGLRVDRIVGKYLVPEPAAATLAGASLVGCSFALRRRRALA